MVRQRGWNVKLDLAQLENRAIVFFLIVGCCLRLLWAADMEWNEEQWMFQQAQKIASGSAPLPIVGMQSEVRVPNPGMTVW